MAAIAELDEDRRAFRRITGVQPYGHYKAKSASSTCENAEKAGRNGK